MDKAEIEVSADLCWNFYLFSVLMIGCAVMYATPAVGGIIVAGMQMKALWGLFANWKPVLVILSRIKLARGTTVFTVFCAY